MHTATFYDCNGLLFGLKLSTDPQQKYVKHITYISINSTNRVLTFK